MNPISEVVGPMLRRTGITPQQMEKQVNLLKQHRAVRSFVERHPDIPSEQYLRSLPQMNQMVSEWENCSRCSGLERCPNMISGHYPYLNQYGGYIEFRMKKCQKLAAFESMKEKQKLIRSLHIPKEILHSSFETMEFDERSEVIAATMDFCMSFSEGIPTKGLYLHGPLGVGKSRIAGAIANKLVEHNIHSYLVYVPDLIREVQDAIQDHSLQQKLQAFKEVQVLILDDIGAEYLTVWKRDEILGALLHYRAAEGLPTIYTSNLDLEELEAHLRLGEKNVQDVMKAKRIMERIEHYTNAYFVDGHNRRKGEL
ncbi:primosomal protein DnaI [Thermoactinomyces sp. DSM 45892]|uniref:primosomal protein DnaI n=1 Tax=Thermoactinomyces sp. DSM 45892 TaxID=1882753 RepID=UPI00089AFD01|nr:primosomal protein DnaI [Thermoactinomyces sp. DSM 45892]SDZ12455.1 replicative DNA helicase loader DnaI [Thermoactinomyces sp. DSM 45892]